MGRRNRTHKRQLSMENDGNKMPRSNAHRKNRRIRATRPQRKLSSSRPRHARKNVHPSSKDLAAALLSYGGILLGLIALITGNVWTGIAGAIAIVVGLTQLTYE